MMRIVLALVCAASLGLSAWLFVENRRLRGLIEDQPARPPAAVAAAEPEEDAAGEVAAAPPAGDAKKGGRAAALLGFVAKTLSSPPPAAESSPPADFDARRDRRQQRMRDLLGRAAGETEEQYRARVAPLVATVLFRPRQRMEDKRREFET